MASELWTFAIFPTNKDIAWREDRDRQKLSPRISEYIWRFFSSILKPEKEIHYLYEEGELYYITWGTFIINIILIASFLNIANPFSNELFTLPSVSYRYNSRHRFASSARLYLRPNTVHNNEFVLICYYMHCMPKNRESLHKAEELDKGRALYVFTNHCKRISITASNTRKPVETTESGLEQGHKSSRWWRKISLTDQFDGKRSAIGFVL